MKKIVLKNVKDELKKLEADKSTIELILNNIYLYNDLVEKYIGGDTSNTYLLYQLNNQIIKQMEGVRRMKLRDKPLDKNEDETSPLSAIKKMIEKRSE